MNARTLPGQLLHELALPDEAEDDLLDLFFETYSPLILARALYDQDKKAHLERIVDELNKVIDNATEARRLARLRWEDEQW